MRVSIYRMGGDDRVLVVRYVGEQGQWLTDGGEWRDFAPYEGVNLNELPKLDAFTEVGA